MSAEWIAERLTATTTDPRWTVRQEGSSTGLLTFGGDDEANAKRAAHALNVLAIAAEARKATKLALDAEAREILKRSEDLRLRLLGLIDAAIAQGYTS